MALAGERPTSARQVRRAGNPTSPARIGSYAVERVLVTSGTGVVHLCHADDGRRVALKVIAPELARDRAFLRQLHAEALHARDVAPACLAEVLDVDVAGRTPYVVTEFLDAPTLAAMIASGSALSVDALARLGAALTTGLAELHREDLVLGDLKPARVALATGGPRFIDFGVARARARFAGGSRRGQPAAAIGTPPFMAPELVLGNPLTAAADVFACGAMVINAATGRSPFGSGSPRALLQRVVYSEPDLAGVPAPLAAVLVDAMRKDPARRISARELADRLLELADPAAAAPVAAPVPHPPAGPVAGVRPVATGLKDPSEEAAPGPRAGAGPTAEGDPTTAAATAGELQVVDAVAEAAVTDTTAVEETRAVEETTAVEAALGAERPADSAPADQPEPARAAPEDRARVPGAGEDPEPSPSDERPDDRDPDEGRHDHSPDGPSGTDGTDSAPESSDGTQDGSGGVL